MTSSDACLSVLMPAYNEEKTIENILQRVLALGPIVKEVVVVDDGSKDGTAAAVERVAATDSRVRFFRQPRNMGKTAAIKEAIAKSEGDVIIIQDADLEYDPSGDSGRRGADPRRPRRRRLRQPISRSESGARPLLLSLPGEHLFDVPLERADEPELHRHRNLLQGVSVGRRQADGAVEPRLRHGSRDDGDGLQDPRADVRSANLLLRSQLRRRERRSACATASWRSGTSSTSI